MDYETAAQLVDNRFDDSVEPESEWWHEHNREQCQELLAQGIRWGLTPEQAIQLICGGFSAAADEYGA